MFLANSYIFVLQEAYKCISWHRDCPVFQFEEKSVHVKKIIYALCIIVSRTLKRSHEILYVPSPDLLSERRTFFQDLRMIDLKLLLKEFQFVMSLKN